MYEQLRVLYAVGPENIIEAYKYWSQCQDAPSQVSVTYSSQFYEVCNALDAKGYAIAQSNKKEFLQDGRFILEHRPVPFSKAPGLLYHLGQLGYGFQLLASAIRFRANVVVASTGTTHWFVWSVLCWMGVKVIPSLHCVLWRKYASQRLGEEWGLKLSRNFFATECHAILAVSPDIAEQVSQLTAGQHRPIRIFLPSFRRAYFTSIAPSDAKRSPFRVLFAGRIEADKGVFDLLEIAKLFAIEGRQDILFDVCGKGSALESLRISAKEANIDNLFICHGYCSRLQMQKMFSHSHVFIVPTRTEFEEGFNRVVAEAILSGRPVVTSAVCPALVYVQDAVVEVPPNDVAAYGNALLKLYGDPEFYEQKRQACLKVQEQFYDISQSWGVGIKSILQDVLARCE
ncbi:MAG TPA: glycosyltransferase [Cyanobacteria bacterium UBA8803]|nr:glycosyltransferase [Cyanobacteria bacterium UBA9273]HBL57837.1 glycosyltransferase [Cyanobacteria bacterium UBA8803]